MMIDAKFKSFQEEGVNVEEILKKASKLQINFVDNPDLNNKIFTIEESVNVSLVQETQERDHNIGVNDEKNNYIYLSSRNIHGQQQQNNDTYQNGLLTEEQKQQLAQISEIKFRKILKKKSQKISQQQEDNSKQNVNQEIKEVQMKEENERQKIEVKNVTKQFNQNHKDPSDTILKSYDIGEH